jgi:hypothetical protein
VLTENQNGKKFSLFYIVHIGSGAHRTSYPMGNGGYFPGVKQQGREADYSSPTGAEVKKTSTYISTSPYIIMV